MLLSNVLGPQAYPGGHFWNGRPVAAGGWVTVGHRFRISLSRPELFNAVCRRRVVHDQFMMRLDERWLSGGALVAMPDNLVVRGRLRAAALVGQPYDTDGIFRPERLTSRHPDDAGNVLIDVGAHTGRLTAVYIDPLGAGGAGWGLGSPEQLSSSVPGAPCAAVPRRAAAG
jgi:hypothetical protein